MLPGPSLHHSHPVPHPIHSPDFQQIFARFYIPFYFNLKVLEIDFLKNQIVRK